MELVSDIVTWGELYLHHSEEGAYCCSRCDRPLYHSKNKWKGPCVWPSFRRPMMLLSTRDRSSSGIASQLSSSNAEDIRIDAKCAEEEEVEVLAGIKLGGGGGGEGGNEAEKEEGVEEEAISATVVWPYNKYEVTVKEVYCGGCDLFIGHQFEDGRAKGDIHPEARWRH